MRSKGIDFAPNIPTEEVFTLPHREQADGHVTMTRPFGVSGVLIESLALTFQHGRVVGVKASNSQDVLEKLLASDEGAARLAKWHWCPRRTLLRGTTWFFYDGFYDENAASHIALGRAYQFTLGNSAGMSEAEFRTAGGNSSLIHEDTMIGSADMDVDGVREDGMHEPVMRAGEWAFDV